MMRSAVIIDDYEKARDVLISSLSEADVNISVVGQAGNVEEGAKLINDLKPDLLFLDIELQDGLIFPLFEKIDPDQFDIIFVTGFDKYAIQAFDYNAIDYILKPANPEDIKRVIDRIDQRNSAFPIKMFNQFVDNFNKQVPFENLGISTVDGVIFVKLNDIVCIDGERNYSILHTTEQKHMLSKPLHHYEELLPPDTFFRGHKSHLINIFQIKSYKKNTGGIEVVMSTGKEISIARRRKSDFMELLKQKKLIID